MENTVSSISFKANLKTFTKVKNKSAYKEVKQLFENSTKKDSKDVLYISDGYPGENRVDIDNSSSAVYMPKIDEQLEKMSAKELAEKLVKIYEMLKSHKIANEKNNQLNSELNKTKAILNVNLRNSTWLSEGKNDIANRYKVLAARNKERISALTKEISGRLSSFNKKIDTLAEKYEELNDLKFKV